MKNEQSKRLFSEALELLPGGVDSPVRAFSAVGGDPLFIDRASGAEIFDVDGNRFIDYVLSWGPLIAGHAHPKVIEAVGRAAARGTSFGAPCEAELELARRIVAAVPGIEVVRFVNSGTEATMSALRVARAYTKREKIVKFQGNYHGHADELLVKAGSGVATLGLPDSPGVPRGATADTLTVPYNDLDAVERLFEGEGREIAAVIVEPVAGNMGVVPPEPGFLEGLRRVTSAAGALLIFDEVMTGFRVHPSGAQGLYGIRPDMTVLGKVIGGGLPVGAYGASREIMSLVAPAGPVYQAGTLSGNPLAMSAGIATLEAIAAPAVWDELERRGEELSQGLAAAAREEGLAVTVNRVGTMFSLFFTDAPVTDWDSASSSDTALFRAYFSALLEAGVYIAPSPFEAGFLSTAHSEAIVAETLEAAARAFRAAARAR